MSVDKPIKVSDEFYELSLVSIVPIDNNTDRVFITIDFYEKSDKTFNGRGIFKYIHSDLPGFTDITPIELSGILVDVFDEYPDNVVYMLYALYDKAIGLIGECSF